MLKPLILVEEHKGVSLFACVNTYMQVYGIMKVHVDVFTQTIT